LLALFLVACGGSTEGLLNLGEASAPEISVSTDGSKEALAETSTTDGTTSTDSSTERGGIESSATETSLPDTSERPPTDAGSDALSVADAYCDLSCEPMCIRLKQPTHACCASFGCGCLVLDAGDVCAY
jgi:hypothetical protein